MDAVTQNYWFIAHTYIHNTYVQKEGNIANKKCFSLKQKISEKAETIKLCVWEQSI